MLGEDLDLLASRGQQSGRAAKGNAEMEMVQRFREGEFTKAQDKELRPGADQGASFGGRGIMGQLDGQDTAGTEGAASAGPEEGAAAAAAPAGQQEGTDRYHRSAAQDPYQRAAAAKDADELVRTGMAIPPGLYDVRLPPLHTVAAVCTVHGAAEAVVSVDPDSALPIMLRYGEVLVKMIAAPILDEDLGRIRDTMAPLNASRPFCAQGNEFEDWQLPATAGVDGIGVVVATAKCAPAALLQSLPAARAPHMPPARSTKE